MFDLHGKLVQKESIVCREGGLEPQVACGLCPTHGIDVKRNVFESLTCQLRSLVAV
jgi:hypothetical protein